MSAFLDFFEGRQIAWKAGRAVWITTTALRYQSDLLGETIMIPADFITDLASTPRAPLIWLAVGGRGTRSATLHDFAYQFGFWWFLDHRQQYVGKPRVDAVLHESLLADPISGAGPWRAWEMWAGVRLGGRGIWGDHARTATLNPAWTAGRWEAP